MRTKLRHGIHKRGRAVPFLLLLLGVVMLLASCSEKENGSVMETDAPQNVLPDMIDWDFSVMVESGREARVLQLTDIQVIDSSQKRHPSLLDDAQTENWKPENKDLHYKTYVTYLIEKTEPDLIIITGDLVAGEYDDNGSSMLDLIAFIDSFQIPWAPVLGNHDWESGKGIDWYCEQLESSAYCLFKRRSETIPCDQYLPGTRNGNYSVAIVQNGKPTRVFFMLDSGTGKPYEAHIGFTDNQIQWYTDEITKIKSHYSNTKISFAFHIQLHAFQDAFQQYVEEPTLDLGLGGDNSDFGYLGRGLKNDWDTDYKVWNSFKSLGVDSVFVGHEHCNSISIVYEGIRLQYGQKSSTYDRANYKMDDGSIESAYSIVGSPIVGGTLIPLNADGEIVSPKIVLYEE